MRRERMDGIASARTRRLTHARLHVGIKSVIVDDGIRDIVRQVCLVLLPVVSQFELALVLVWAVADGRKVLRAAASPLREEIKLLVATGTHPRRKVLAWERRGEKGDK